MAIILDALCRLLAPVLAFTAEETWSYFGRGGSVHLQLFPEIPAYRVDSFVSEQIDQLLKLRAVIGQAVEKARQEKLIGNSLEARVKLRCNRALLVGIPEAELEEFFILSDLTIEEADEPWAQVEKTPFAKCARCWRHRESVGKSSTYPDLCDRCAAVVTSLEVRAAGSSQRGGAGTPPSD